MPSTSEAPGVRCGLSRGAEALLWLRRRGGRSGSEAGVGASGKVEKGEAPTSRFLLSLRPSAPLPPTTSIFFGCR